MSEVINPRQGEGPALSHADLENRSVLAPPARRRAVAAARRGFAGFARRARVVAALARRAAAAYLAPLTADYWPPHASIDVDAPWRRAVLATLAAPTPAFLGCCALAFFVFQADSDTAGGALWLTMDFGAALAPPLWASALVGGGLGFLLLWTLRLTGRRSAALVGSVVGLATAMVVGAVEDGATLVSALFLIGVGVANQLSLRWLAGVRKRRGGAL